MSRHLACVIAGAATILSLIASPVLAGENPSWQELSTVGKAHTRGVTAFWGGLPELNAKARIKVLDVDGPFLFGRARKRQGALILTHESLS